MDDPLSFDYQALADEQVREAKERAWQAQGRLALLLFVAVAAALALLALVGSLLPTITP